MRTVLGRAAEEAHERIAAVGRRLVEILDELHRIVPLTDHQAELRQTAPVEGLPSVDLPPSIRGSTELSRWWGSLFPGLATLAMRRSLTRRFGEAIHDAVDFYDRSLRRWAATELERWITDFESQAAPLREQVRRLGSLANDPDPIGDASDLEADLRALHATGAQATASIIQPGDVRQEGYDGPIWGEPDGRSGSSL